LFTGCVLNETIRDKNTSPSNHYCVRGWGVAHVGPSMQLDTNFRVSLACILALLAFSLDIVAISFFRRASTTIRPLKPKLSSSLVISGIYTITRNPMYLGMVFLLLGWSVYLNSLFALICVPLFIAYITHFQIKP